MRVHESNKLTIESVRARWAIHPRVKIRNLENINFIEAPETFFEEI